MSPTTEARIKRLRSRFRELAYWIDRDAVDLPGWTFDGRGIAIGDRWGLGTETRAPGVVADKGDGGDASPSGGHSGGDPYTSAGPAGDGVVTFALGRQAVPDGWPLQHTRLDLDLGGEGLVRIAYDGADDEQFGLDPHHQRFPLRDRSFAVEGRVVPRFPFGEPNRDARLGRARLVLIDPAVERLFRQLYLVAEAACVLEQHPAAVPMIAAAERALASIDWPSETPIYLARIRDSSWLREIWTAPADLDPHPPGLTDTQSARVDAASEALDEALTGLLGLYPHEGKILLTGHAHLDLAWLWPLAETRRKARRTWSSMIALLERFPEFHFNQSSAQLYAFVEQDDPELFAKVRGNVESGHWEPVGGMWVEPDTNMPAGESLVRQLLYGQRYFQRTFGDTHRVCWLPDCFGFTPALPQLLRLAGISSFFTIKLTWSETNKFPYDLFWWEGIDGSRVLAHMFDNPAHKETHTDGYNGDPGPFALTMTWRNFRGKSLHPESLLSIGYGDGGGGVTEEMLAQAEEVPRLPAIPEAHFGRIEDFYERLHESAAGREIPLWQGELYLELHRGTLTTQGRTKFLHRRSERDLVAAEVLSALNALIGGPQPESLEAQWKVLLRNEFHDILPGSSIREVYQTAEAELASVRQEAGCRIEQEMSRLAERIVPKGDQPALLLANPDLAPRPVRVQLDAETATSVPGVQPVEGGGVLAAAVSVPALGAQVLTHFGPAGSLDVSPEHLENAYLRVEIRSDGTLGRVHDKRAQRLVTEGRANQIWAYIDKPPTWDAWDIDIGYREHGEEIPAVAPPAVVEHGPHRAAVRVVRVFRSSRITQDIRLWSNSARLEFATTIEWHDRRWLVKARFPLAVRSSSATFETAFGVIERSTQRNTSWESARFEVAGHRFADLSEPGYGVALLNDGKYGYHAIGQELGLTLLRSPVHPDPLADEGEQSFTYALYPHLGRVGHGGTDPIDDVLMEAEDLNRPCSVLPVRSAKASVTQEILSIKGPRLGLGALKAVEQGDGLILRAYEPSGARGEADVALPPGWRAASEVDLLERDTGAPEFSFGPFQVHSWRLERG
jgi:alpha-mannosidase